MIRETPEISAGSMADIAFLLLIFFLVTTTMDVDSGIVRKLPPPIDESVPPPPVNKRNIYTVLINSGDMLLVNGKIGNLAYLRKDVKEFLRPHFPNNPNFPETKPEEIDFIGTYNKSKGIVSMQNDRGTSYKTYIHVQNELAAAVRELRDELSKQYFGMDFKALLETDEEKAKAVQEAIPMSISEAEPVNFGGEQ